MQRVMRKKQRSAGGRRRRAERQRAGPALPTGYALYHNYPNPFNPSTEIRFDLPQAAPVTLLVYDVTGRQVARLFDAERAAGTHALTFEATGLPSGVYIYRIQAGSFTRTRPMGLLK